MLFFALEKYLAKIVIVFLFYCFSFQMGLGRNSRILNLGQGVRTESIATLVYMSLTNVYTLRLGISQNIFFRDISLYRFKIGEI